MSDPEQAPPAEVTGKPTPAGMYDYFLGGTHNSAADRAAADRIIEKIPEIRDAAWANRGFLARAVRWMAAEHGVRQFIDIGAGLPTQRATHDVLRAVAPDCRVLYTDIDPRVIARGHEILAGVAGTAVIEADFRDPGALLGDPRTLRLIDFSEPAGLLVVAVTQFVADEDDPWALVRRYLAALAPGSYLALSAPTFDHQDERKVGRAVEVYATSTAPAGRPRTRAEIERFFADLEIVPPYRGAVPGVTYVGLWGCEDPEAADTDGSRWFYAAVGRKPEG
jgi:SAM-dependent methyltransferase